MILCSLQFFIYFSPFRTCVSSFTHIFSYSFFSFYCQTSSSYAFRPWLACLVVLINPLSCHCSTSCCRPHRDVCCRFHVRRMFCGCWAFCSHLLQKRQKQKTSSTPLSFYCVVFFFPFSFGLLLLFSEWELPPAMCDHLNGGYVNFHICGKTPWTQPSFVYLRLNNFPYRYPGEEEEKKENEMAMYFFLATFPIL